MRFPSKTGSGLTTAATDSGFAARESGRDLQTCNELAVVVSQSPPLLLSPTLGATLYLPTHNQEK